MLAYARIILHAARRTPHAARRTPHAARRTPHAHITVRSTHIGTSRFTPIQLRFPPPFTGEGREGASSYVHADDSCGVDSH